MPERLTRHVLQPFFGIGSQTWVIVKFTFFVVVLSSDVEISTINQGECNDHVKNKIEIAVNHKQHCILTGDFCDEFSFAKKDCHIMCCNHFLALGQPDLVDC